MKKFVVIMALLASTPAYAHGPGGWGGGGFHGGGFGGGGFGHPGGGWGGGGFRPPVNIGRPGWGGGWNGGGWRGPVVGGAIAGAIISGANNWGRPWGVPWGYGNPGNPPEVVWRGPVYRDPGNPPVTVWRSPPPVYYDSPPPAYYEPPPPPPVYYEPPPRAYYPPPPLAYYPPPPPPPVVVQQGPSAGEIIAGVIQGLGPILQQMFVPPPPPVFVTPPPIDPPRRSYTPPRVELDAPPLVAPPKVRRAPAPIEPLTQNGSGMNGHVVCKTKDGTQIDIVLAMNAKTKQLTNFHVVFTKSDGGVSDRSEQYNNIKFSSDRSNLKWEGDRAHMHMIATMSQDGTYVEVLFDNGKPKEITRAKCSEPAMQ